MTLVYVRNAEKRPVSTARKTGQVIGCLSYQHLQKTGALDDEA